MDRRNAIKNIGMGISGAILAQPASTIFGKNEENTSKSFEKNHPLDSGYKIAKIRYHNAPDWTKPLFNQSRFIVEVETDSGAIGIGEGGTPDMVKQLAEMLIGEDPFRIEHLWQHMYRSMFYPPGREKLHGLGAIDMALWDLKGKVLGVPVYEMLGGATREYVECYSGSANALEQGFRLRRIGPTGGSQTGLTQWSQERGNGRGFDFYENVKATIALCERVAAEAGGGNWAIDLHTRFDTPDSIRICKEIEHLQPYFVEDPIRTENVGVFHHFRQQTNVPIAHGEQYGDKWQWNELVENHLIDYSRGTIPNVGGISEFKKIASMCETHYVGLIPHFTGPLGTAACVHAMGASSNSRCMMEFGGGRGFFPEYFNDDMLNFKDGKLYLNPRPGLGVEFNASKAELLFEVTENTPFPHPYLQKPDGAIQNW